jgi:HK97 family phage major capsid protein
MDMQERTLRAKISQVVAECRAILEKAEKEKRAMRSDENEQYNRLDSELDRLNLELALYLKNSTRDNFNHDEFRKVLFGDETLFESPVSRNYGKRDQRDLRYEPEGRRAAFERYIREGVNALDGSEYRALQADSSTAGGYLVLPMQLANRLIVGLNNSVFIRNLATIYPCPGSESLGAPTVENDLGDPTWTSELGTGNEDNTLSFGKRELTPHPLARLIKVSNKLVRAAFIDVESVVMDRFAYKFGTVQENAFLNGSGSNQPMGVFTAAQSGFGITTSRDVSTGNTTTAITADGLIEALYSLKAQYRKNAQWIFHRDAVKKIRKLKDGDGQYLWQVGFAQNKPDSILGLPYNESEYCPNTFTAGLYVGIVGDFSFYWIAEALQMQIQRLVELYAASNQTGYIGRIELDGMPVDENAFSRVTLAP